MAVPEKIHFKQTVYRHDLRITAFVKNITMKKGKQQDIGFEARLFSRTMRRAVSGGRAVSVSSSNSEEGSVKRGREAMSEVRQLQCQGGDVRQGRNPVLSRARKKLEIKIFTQVQVQARPKTLMKSSSARGEGKQKGVGRVQDCAGYYHLPRLL